MEPSNSIGYEMVDHRKEVLYIFNPIDEDVKESPKVEYQFTKFWQIALSFMASFSCIPFGLMLGWPCPTYPILLEENEEPGIVISWDESAMIAGFLMLGNTFGTPFSTTNFVPSKYGVLIGTFVMLIGCCLMWLASDIYWLLGSRFLVGFGHSFSLGRLRQYIKEVCDGNTRLNMIKQVPLHNFFGVATVVSFGSFVDFEKTAMILTITTAVIFLILIFLPQVPGIHKKTKKCNIMNTSLVKVLKDKNLRRKFSIFFILVLCQQYSGVPATIIYAQKMFEKFHVTNAKIFAIAYMVLYFFSNVLGIFVMPKYEKRSVLLFSSLGVSVVIIIEVVITFLKIDQLYWTYISVTVIYLYLFLHTLGLGNIPFTLISDFFPQKYRDSIILFFIMFHSMLALTITKIFQVVIYTLDHHISIPFCMFLCFSFTAFLVSYFTLEDKTEDVQKNTKSLIKK